MTHTIDKLLNPYTLIIFNFIVIVAAETVGGGHYFYESGLIHVIAILFILLAASRLLTRFHLGDPIFKKFVVATSLAMLIFAASHIIEFAGYFLFHSYEDSIFVNVINFYAMSLLLIVLGKDFMLSALAPKRRKGVRVMVIAGLALFAGLTAVNIMNDRLISLEPDAPAPWLYSVAVLAIAIVALRGIAKLQRRLPRFAAYMRDISFAVVLILMALLPNIFYEGLEENLGIEKYQIIYLHHFGFYAALSVMYLAFDKLQHLGGVLKDLRESELDAPPTPAGAPMP